MLRTLLGPLLAALFLLAEPADLFYDPGDETALAQQDLNTTEDLNATQEPIDEALLLDPLRPKLIYLTPQELPSTLYVGQSIELTVNALVTESNYDHFSVKLHESSGVRRIGPGPRWERVDDNRHRMRLFFRITDTQVRLPEIETRLYIDGALEDMATLELPARRANPVATNPHFTGVIANELEIITHKVERFGEGQNILVMDLQGHLSNLADFSLQGVETQGTDWVDDRPPQTRIFYYALIPADQEGVRFNYFDPTTGDYRRFDLSFDLSNLGQRISTHADISPKSRSIPWLEIFLLSVASILLILFWFKTHRNLFLVMVALTVVLAVWLVLRDERVTIQEGAQVRLLPTSTSTLFYVTYRPTEAIALKRKDGYIKVHLPDDKIGWIREEEALD